MAFLQSKAPFSGLKALKKWKKQGFFRTFLWLCDRYLLEFIHRA
jgi:hypothetical protein